MSAEFYLRGTLLDLPCGVWLMWCFGWGLMMLCGLGKYSFGSFGVYE